ncbi:hypothetical protein AAMO2058_001440300 [Amorphochlora amoebiformis]
MVVILLPFLILSIAGPAMNPIRVSNLFLMEKETTWSENWANLLNVLYWNFSGIDSASTSAGEVVNPSRDVPKGLIACVGLTTITYLIPLVSISLVNRPSYQGWEDGDFSSIAEQQVGRWLTIWIACAGVVGNAGMYVAEMFEDSWQLHGMAEVGLAPPIFKYRHPRLQTPWTCIFLQMGIISVVQAFDFDVILCIDNFFSVASVLLEIVAFLYLRYTRPHLPRPYRLPLSNIGATILMIPIIILGILVAFAGLTNSLSSLIINVGTLVLGIIGAWYLLYANHATYIPRSTASNLGDSGDSCEISGDFQRSQEFSEIIREEPEGNKVAGSLLITSQQESKRRSESSQYRPIGRSSSSAGH